DAADAGGVHGRQRAARVEPVPPEPEDDAADRRDGQVVAGHGAATVTLELATDARAQDDGAAQRDHAADRVDDRRAGEVVERRWVDGVQPAVGSPGPVADDRVDEAADAEAVQQVAREAGPAD